MTKARNLQRCDKINIGVNLEVLSTELVEGLVKIRAAAIGTPSLNFGDNNCVLEIICTSYRDFSAQPYRGDGDDGGDWSRS
jgi:hypothetical protein